MAQINIGNRIRYKRANIYRSPRNEKMPRPEQINARVHETQNEEEKGLVFQLRK